MERGNTVQFGPEPEQSYVAKAQSGKKTTMEKKGVPFAIKADLVKKFGEHEGFARQAR